MGAGPIAWRQMTAAVRNSKGLLFVMLILAMSVGPLLFSTKQGNGLTGAVVGVDGLGSPSSWGHGCALIFAGIWIRSIT